MKYRGEGNLTCRILFYLFCCWFGLGWASQESDGEKTCPSSVCVEEAPPPSPCKLYIAPSTIPGAGLGIFTAVQLEEDDELPGDVILPSIDSRGYSRRNFFAPFVDFQWRASVLGMEMETFNDDDIGAFCPGIDALVNCHFLLNNVHRGDFQYDDGIGGHRSKSPSAGSMTPFNNASTVVSSRIRAGGEFFKNYGEEWFEERKESLGAIPFKRDYFDGESLLRYFDLLSQTFGFSHEARRDFYRIITSLLFKPPSRIMNTLPRDYMHVDAILNGGSMFEFHEQNSTRSIKELERDGRCIDNIRQGNSTLPFAGRGAFTTRIIKEGEIITGTPLIHVPTMDLAKIFDENNDTRYQVWINYCYGHAQADLLLCPYGSGVHYINHNQSLTNVRIQFSPNGIMSQDDTWLNLSRWNPYEVVKTHLGIDYVATRDIEEGEELFLDYGNEFDKAWNDHVEKWESIEEDESYVSSRQWNDMHTTDLIRTEEEQEADPYPSNLLLRCPSRLIGNRTSSNVRRLFKRMKWPSNDKLGMKCHVFEREQYGDQAYYVVQVVDSETGDSQTRQFIKMIDAPHSTDWHLPKSFRHWIGIPDEIFPDAWRKKRKGNGVDA